MVAGREIDSDIGPELGRLERSNADALRLIWRNHLGGSFPNHLPHWLQVRLLAYRLQAAAHGDLDAALRRRLRQSGPSADRASFAIRSPAATDGRRLPPGTLLVRQWRGQPERVMVLEEGFAWNGRTWNSLSQVAKAMTGAHWNGHRFFGLQRKVQRNGQKTAWTFSNTAPKTNIIAASIKRTATVLWPLTRTGNRSALF